MLCPQISSDAHPIVERLLGIGDYRGHCAEVQAISSYLRYLESRLGKQYNTLTLEEALPYTTGAVLKTARVRAMSMGEPETPCPACNPLIEGLNSIYDAH